MDAKKTVEQVSPQRADPPPMSVVALSVLSIIAETAARNLGASLPGADAGQPQEPAKLDLREARLAIDAANAMLAVVRSAMSNDERIAIEGILTQLQVEYVKRMSARA